MKISTSPPLVKHWEPSNNLGRGNAAEQILEGLRGQILSGRFPRGSRLPSEKQLADGYSVSGPTVREAIRGLITTGLVTVRHGAGTFVTSDPDQLLHQPLRSMIEFERIGVPEVLGVLSALNGHAAELAATRATVEELSRMRAAMEAIHVATDAQTISQQLSLYLDELSEASGSPLLGVLCRFLGNIQVGLLMELCRDSLPTLKRTVRKLTNERRQLVDALESRKPEDARIAARNYHSQAIKVITSLPRADATFVADPTLSSLLAAAKLHSKD